MNLALELLKNDTLADRQEAARCLTPLAFRDSKDQAKHKVAVQVSSMLKSQGVERACGATFARLCFADWSIVKSHGSSWANIMLHALDLPDRICWAPCVNALAVLYTKIHGKAELSREIGGSRVGEFVKRLLKLVPEIHCQDAVATMLELYPTQCRPYLNKLEPLLRGRALANLCISEKQQAQVWEARVLRALEADELVLVAEYLEVAAIIKAKVPARPIYDKFFSLLSSLQPGPALNALQFFAASFKHLRSAYLQKFDQLVYQMAECVDMGSDVAVAALGALRLLVRAVGWTSKGYTAVFCDTIRKALTLLKRREVTVSANGLADFTQNPGAFSQQLYSRQTVSDVVQFLVDLSTAVPSIPQSLRVQMDRVVLDLGTREQVVQISLYPGKFSVLPLAVRKLSTLAGLEALVHPRLPPLTRSYDTQTRLEKELRESELRDEAQDEVDDGAETEADAVHARLAALAKTEAQLASLLPAQTVADVEEIKDHEAAVADAECAHPVAPTNPLLAAGAAAETVTKAAEPAEPVPQSRPAAPASASSAAEPAPKIHSPPNKRVKLDAGNVEMAFSEPTSRAAAGDSVDSDSDSDFAMPTLTMDSD